MQPRFSEFFLARSLDRRSFAWAGFLIIFLGTAGLQFLALRIVLWQGEFFGKIQELIESDTTTQAAAQASIVELAINYLYLLVPSALLQPALRRLTRQYTLEWRFSLMEEYTDAWERDRLGAIEGASQRLQEDTKKFGEGVQLLVREVVTAVFALGVFGPFLVELGTKIPLPLLPRGAGGPAGLADAMADAWLLGLAILLSGGGLLVASFVARRLVDLDIDNQRIEASFRKMLVQAEGGGERGEKDERGAAAGGEAGALGAVGGGADGAGGGWVADALRRFSVPSVRSVCAGSTAVAFGSGTGAGTEGGAAGRPAPLPAMHAESRRKFRSLKANYTSLYNNLVAIDGWNSLYNRGVAVLPFLLAAPAIFEPGSAVGLGELQMLRFVFIDVFVSLNAFAVNWPEINELRATVRRLRTFEAARPSKATRPPNVPPKAPDMPRRELL